MEQIITASHIVKPSSPTPVTSKTHKLSFLDQLAPPVYITLIFFYQNAQSKQQQEISRRLKQSLSEILTVFYPLAGTIKQNTFVDCNDSGAKFVEARVHARLIHFTQNPKMEQLSKLIPAGFSSAAVDNPILSVKTSYFDCGGVAVAVCFPHKHGDTASFATFMNAWAAAASRGEASRIIQPSFDLALRFPPKDIFASGSESLMGLTEEKMATRRLVFDEEKVERIRKLEASRSEMEDPTRLEAVSAFLWRSFIHAHKQTRAETSSFPTCHMVNMRRRAAPPVPDYAFGNCFTLALALVSGDGDEDLLVARLRAAIRGVDEDYVQGIGDDEFARAAVDEIGGLFGSGSGNCIFTSWLRFPLYDVDFGWGKPVRVCPGTMPYMNVVILMDTPFGDGIEAWINVSDDHFFQFLQTDYDMLFT